MRDANCKKIIIRASNYKTAWILVTNNLDIFFKHPFLYILIKSYLELQGLTGQIFKKSPIQVSQTSDLHEPVINYIKKNF